MRQIFILLAVIFVVLSPVRAATPADSVIWGGPIYSGGESGRPVAALAIRDGRFVAMGSRSKIKRLVGPQTRIVELRGSAAFPGFTDGHAHLHGIGARELELNLEGTASVVDLRARVSAWATQHQDPVLIGRGWIETHWPEGRMPDATDLDPIAPGRPMLLVRADGHALVANSAALRQAGITAATADPPGGRLIRTEEGSPNGILIDRAMDLVAGLLPAQTPQRASLALDKALEVYPALGWTGVHNMSVDWLDVTLLEARAAQSPLPLRIYNAVTPQASTNLFASGKRFSLDGRVVTRGVKLYADGALGSRGAALFAPYSDSPETSGLILLTEQDRAIMRQAKEQGLQIAVHAIGDRANALVLTAFEELLGCGPTAALGTNPSACRAHRWRIEHAQILRPADISRFAADGVIASMQPSHAISDLYFAPSRLGEGRIDGAYAWKSLVQSGAIVVGGSDAPVERGAALIEFYAAIARTDLKGASGPDWRPGERLSRREALNLFTLAPAYASFQEDDLGSIAIGKRADVSVFSVDLMRAKPAEILQGHAVLTMVGGKVAYRAKGW